MFTLHSSQKAMWGTAMMILWMFQLVVIISGQDVQVWKFRDGEPANLTVLGDTGNGCKFVLKRTETEDRTCCYMNKEAQEHPDYNICKDQQSEDCISKKRFVVSEPAGQGECILTLTNFHKSDAGIYIVEFPNENNPLHRRKKIEIIEQNYEVKEFVVGQTATVVFKGDIKEEGCKFEAHLGSRTCCYEGKKRQSCEQENQCADIRNSSTYEVKEDENKCVLHLKNFQKSDVGEYEVIFPVDKDDNETFMMKESLKESWIAANAVYVGIAVLFAIVIVLIIVLAAVKYKNTKHEAQGSEIFTALHNKDSELFTERLNGRNILKVRDRHKNNLFHKVADKNWTTEMTDILRLKCPDIFSTTPKTEQDGLSQENIELETPSYSERQKIFCAMLPHPTCWDTKMSQIFSWTIKHSRNNWMTQFLQIIFPLTFIDLNSQNDSGKTPLHIAAEKNDLDIVKVLLRQDVKPNIKDCDGCTPLHCAVLLKCERNKPPKNIMLVQEMMNNSEVQLMSTTNGQNILHSAVMRNNLEVLKVIKDSTEKEIHEGLLKEKYSQVTTNKVTKKTTFCWKEKTPLELAAMFGNKNIVKYLLGEDKHWKNESGGMQIIFSAIFSSQRNIVGLLLDNGGIFDPNWVIKNNEGDTCLFFCRKEKKDDTCLQKAIRDKNKDAVNIIINHPSPMVNDATQIDEALTFATTEIHKARVEQGNSVNKTKIEKKSQEKTESIIRALENKRGHMSTVNGIPDNEENIKKLEKLKKEKKNVLDIIKIIEEESELEKEKYKKDELAVHRENLSSIVQNLIKLNGPKEDKNPSRISSIEIIEDELKNIKSRGRDINPKRVKHFMNLLKQTVPLERD